MKYDVIIVGAGPMGIYTAYEFMIKAPNMRVLLIDKGNDIYTRKCPLPSISNVITFDIWTLPMVIVVFPI